MFYPIPSHNFLMQLKAFEGFSAVPYVCPAGKATIGYGTNLEAHPRCIPFDDVRGSCVAGLLRGKALVEALKKRGMRWSMNEAEAAMREEVEAVRHELEERCPTYGDLLARDEYVRAEALLDMAYNMGVGRAPSGEDKGCGLLMFYSFLPRMQRGYWAAAADGLASTRWYKQVGRRSRAIAQQIRSGVYA